MYISYYDLFKLVTELMIHGPCGQDMLTKTHVLLIINAQKNFLKPFRKKLYIWKIIIPCIKEERSRMGAKVLLKQLTNKTLLLLMNL